MKQIQIGRVPGEIKTYVVEDNATVADALRVAGITQITGESLVLNGDPASLESQLANGTTLLLTRQVKGNGSF